MTMVEPEHLTHLAPEGSVRLLADATTDLATHHRRRGPLPWQRAPGRLVGVIEAAGLTGRGGAGFPRHASWPPSPRAAESSSVTARKANRPAARTVSYWIRPHTWSSTACNSPPRRSAPHGRTCMCGRPPHRHCVR